MIPVGIAADRIELATIPIDIAEIPIDTAAITRVSPWILRATATPVADNLLLRKAFCSDYKSAC
ncbi:MAG TPA: hypothetical protein VII34_12820 [Pyrinomonadaceae bacterium]